MTEDDFDKYALYDTPEETIRRKPRKAPPPVALEELTENSDSENSLQITYKPSRFEATWLLSSLRSFYEQNLICDVLSHIKGGKEASVYCCRAGATVDQELLAVKVYRPRRFRNLRNDAMYREGRAILTADGSPVKKTDHRILRAVGKKSEFGVQVQHTSWLMHEYTTMERLFHAGAAVPQPLAAGDNAILMGYRGDVQRPAPALSEVRLERQEAETLFAEVLRNIELLLQQGHIHGDLSAYNILYWEGEITLIDFPQVTEVQTNKNAYFILQRDITRVCDYFVRQGVACDPADILLSLWAQYGKSEDEAEMLGERSREE